MTRPRFQKKDAPAIIAHRAGPDGRWPENSIAAVRASIRLGVDGIEIDVRRGARDVFHVVHDPVDVDKAPTLDEFLPIATRGLVFLDVKEPMPVRPLVLAATRRVQGERLIFGSFWHPFVRDVKRAFPRILTAATVEARVVDPVGLARKALADILAIEHRFIDAGTVRSAHRAGLKIYAWTVNDSRESSRLVKLGVDALITDVPSRMI